MEYWDKRLDEMAEVEGRAPGELRTTRTRQERWVEDIQMCRNKPVATAGYPIVSYLGRTVINEEKSARHIVLHEYGHLYQGFDWVLPGTNEISNDAIFSAYSFDNLADAETTLDSISENRGCRAGCGTLSEYKSGTMGQMYKQLRAFSWRFYANVLRTYRDDPPSKEEVKNSAGKLATWAKRTSEAAGKNLAPFFNNYGFKLPQELMDELAGRFDKWEKDPTLPLP